VTWQLRELGRVCLLCRGPCSCHLGAGNNGRATLSPGCCWAILAPLNINLLCRMTRR